MKRLDILSKILEDLPDATAGLPDQVFDFVRATSPLVNVDLMVVHPDKGVLLAWRNDTWGVGWHVPGGIVRFKESLRSRLQNVAKLEIGVPLKFADTPTAISQFTGQRGHFISILFECTLAGTDPATKSPKDHYPTHGDICWFNSPPSPLYPAHKSYIPRLRPFCPASPLGLAEPFVDLND